MPPIDQFHPIAISLPLARRRHIEFYLRMSLLLTAFGATIGITCLPAIPCRADESKANLVVRNAVVITVDHARPAATAFAVRDGRFVTVGDEKDVRPLIGPATQVIDAGGRCVTPGFYDAHLHPQPEYPEDSPLGVVDCDPSQVKTIDELIARLRAKADRTPPGQWVKGFRYQDTKLGRHPAREDLDKVSTKHPVYLDHSSWHLAAANSFALRLAHVTRETKDPEGGRFDRDGQGEPTGVLRETARQLVLDAGPTPPLATTAQKLAGMRACFRQYVRNGITSIADAGATPETLQLYQLVQSEEPLLRIYVMMRYAHLEALKTCVAQHGRGNEWLKLGAVKHFHGNSLSGQTCWLYQPYHDRPGYFGIPPQDSQEKLNQIVLEIHRAGFQACIHSNGDREIDMVLNAYAHALDEMPRADHRHRIEHCSVVNEQILKRIRQLGVVVALHSYEWEHGDKMEAYGPERWDWMHPNRAALDLGIPVAGTSDSPVSEPRPLLRIQSMVTRTSAEGKVYGARQRVSVEQAIEIWTLGSAFASFDEKEKGSITPGKLADFAVLSTDPRKVPADKIKDIRVLMTVVGGRIVHREGL
ncbi:MAG: amidohydrolase [Planctomycetia bacterium]|nr:amidohydrolase [Planctomycetia bacterium]